MTQSRAKVAIIDFGSQHTLQIGRCLRELGHRYEIVSPSDFERLHAKRQYRSVIGSGGHRSVYEKDAPRVYLQDNVPFLGICYAMQDMVHQAGGTVAAGTPEYARATLLLQPSRLFSEMPTPLQVWMSHGDTVTELPPDFKVIAYSDNGNVAAIAHKQLPHFGVQFHPEVHHTEKGTDLLKNFLESISGLDPDYQSEDLAGVLCERVAREVGEDDALLLYSGGIDSTVTAVLAKQAIGDRLHCVTFDGGQLREGEIDEIRRNASFAGIKLTVIDCDDFIAAVSQTIDPEGKRKAFREVYARLTREAAARFGAKKILQGTIAPDRIESGKTGGAVIKTHHNSKGLDFGGLVEVTPLDELYKDEVRRLAEEAGLPAEAFNRPPFPGPGNFLRTVNIPVTRETLQVTQWADARVRELIAKDDRYRTVSQVVVAVIGRAVGVKGDGRVYGYMVAVRAVRTKDFMTAEGVTFAEDFQAKVCQLLGTYPAIVQVGFFPMDKPPGTTEFE